MIVIILIIYLSIISKVNKKNTLCSLQIKSSLFWLKCLLSRFCQSIVKFLTSVGNVDCSSYFEVLEPVRCLGKSVCVLNESLLPLFKKCLLFLITLFHQSEFSCDHHFLSHLFLLWPSCCLKLFSKPKAVNVGPHI